MCFLLYIFKICGGKRQRIRHQAVEAFVGCGEEKGEMRNHSLNG